MINPQSSAVPSHIDAFSPTQPGFGAPYQDAATVELLVAGGDARLVLDSVSGVNKYGAAPRPDPELADFGSSTASVI